MANMKTPNVAESESVAVEIFSVSIKVIRVNNKQMTQAVFRQLPQGTEDKSSTLWGIVKYDGIGRYQGQWLVFSQSGKLFRRELDLSQRGVDQYDLTRAKEQLKYHGPSYYAYKDEPGYWEKQSQTYSAERVKQERAEYEKSKYEYESKKKALQKAVEEEEQYVFNEQKAEVNRYSYEHGLVKKLPQLFIAV